MNDHEEDPELVRRLASGDGEALALLFAQHRERLRRMIEFRIDRRLNRRLDSEDILQESYIAAQKRIASFTDEPGHSAYVWLRLVVGQTMIDLYRQHVGAKMRNVGKEVVRHRSPTNSGTMSAFFVASITSPSQAAARAEFAEQLEQILGSMDDIDREVLVLRHFEEATNNEVAQILGLQPTAASNRYVRALGRLRGILQRISDFKEQEDERR